MPKTKGTSGSYAAGRATREAILVGALEMIARTGYAGFSLRDLGRKIGISHPTLMYHFPSKELLYLEVVCYFEEQLGLVNAELDREAVRLEFRGTRVQDIVGWVIALMKWANSPEAANFLAMDRMLYVEGLLPDHPAYEYIRQRGEAMFALFEASVDGLIMEEHSMFLTKRQAAEIFFQKWYGMAMLAEFKGQGFDMRSGIAYYLADVAFMLGLKPDDILRFGTLIPDEVAEVYTLTLKSYSDIKKQHEGTR